MTKISIIGATGSLGRAVTAELLASTDVELTLFSRTAGSLPDNPRFTKISASVFDQESLQEAIKGSQLVFAALSGDLPKMAKSIISAMQEVGVKRLIFISSYGIYSERVEEPGALHPMLKPYRQAADLIEASGLDYTILRPGWFDNSSDKSYQLIPKGETIYGNEISRLAIADFVASCVRNPLAHIRENLGIVR